MALELHPLCTLFPRLAGAEFDALKADIAANGQRELITVHEGLVLDGGNRYRACIEAGVEPMLREFAGSDPVAFVLSANLHRRHLTPGQQAAIVASAQDWTRAQANGGDRRSDQSATLHSDTAADRAAQSGASIRTQKMADKVAKASPELAKQVAHGEISLPKALEQLAPKAAAAPAASAWPFPNAAPGSPAAEYNASLEAAAGAVGNEEDVDGLYEQAVQVVLKNRRASISLVQRHLRVGYNRAARLLEQMEKSGVVSPMQSNGDRIIMTPADLTQSLGDERAEDSDQDDTESAAEVTDDDGHQQLLDDYNAAKQERDALQTKVAELDAHIGLLGRADLNAEVATTLTKRAADAEYKFEQLSGRNRQLQQTAHDAQTTSKYQAELLTKIRLALGVESNAEILPAITARRAA